ncbi:hypothetical protein GUH47_26085 [Xanthomonas citri pv. citri]|nr:exonuclease [Achromobacter phage vB_Ade_ART]MBD4209384.1 hypothetical protein [Xanthomonas citri pv. citri]
MTIYLAEKTLELIDQAIEKDQGALYRQKLGEVIMEVTDAYDNKPPDFRSHFGVSTSGRPCARSLWYNWRWVTQSWFSGRMLRLFNRGHLEEARFVAMLRAAGITLYQSDENMRQFRIEMFGGHYGSAIDGVAVGIPDLPDPEMLSLVEFKTHNDKSFKKLQANGVKKSKPEHYAQMVQYIDYWDLDAALYLAVNKNDDTLYGELIPPSESEATYFRTRSQKIIFQRNIPPRFSDAPDTFECRFCDHKMRCHYQQGEVARNCRTCSESVALENGTWVCSASGEVLDKEAQKRGCEFYNVHSDL